MVTLTLVSCTKTPTDKGEDINMSLPKYIYFDAAAATKGPLVEDMAGKDFEVIGYTYAKAYGVNWDTFKALGTPMAEFYKKRIVYDGGIFTYDPIQFWNGSNRYTFFAYYPCEMVNSVATGVAVNGTQSTSGTPSITYTISNSAKSDQSKLYDVMTAMVKDTDNSSDGIVTFHFYHKLFCVEVMARNYDTTPVTIKDARISFNSLTESITIPLDSNMPVSTSGTFGPATYQISDSTPIELTGSSKQITGTDKMIFIPQTGLHGTISFTQVINGVDYPKNETFSSSKDFKAGMKYTLSIAFANDALSVAVLESSAWEDVNQNIIFE